MQTVASAYLQSLRFDRFFEDPTIDRATPNAYASRRFGNFLVGSRNDDSLTFMHPLGPAALITASSVFAYAERTGAAPASYVHKAASANVVQLGQWFFGARDGNHFVINKVNATVPQLLIRNDGIVFVRKVATGGQANTDWPLLESETAKYIRIGNWLIGAKDNNHFVINRVGATRPQFLLRSDGQIFRSSEDGPVSQAFAMVDVPVYSSPVGATVTLFPAADEWLFASAGSEALIISKDSNAAPAMVVREDRVYVTEQVGTAIADMVLTVDDAAVTTLGDWLIGVKNDAFVINTIAAQTFWPQFAIESSGTLRVKGLAGIAPKSYLRNSTSGQPFVGPCRAISCALQTYPSFHRRSRLAIGL